MTPIRDLYLRRVMPANRYHSWTGSNRRVGDSTTAEPPKYEEAMKESRM